ncbi:hypothetical protein AKJ62_01415 [candidate division MSBL1 archaeon SCGC-AAA259D14]|uniref:Uncharacterized protein n=1 Tax=candidate division MSBL1 archaeon SCGC-AAA259D14 TaxID=1698261 RepID=A0A133U7P1_9EURY|nr:hypothetical protein AKJ62_01415 [candidate division MSBL1 archaeon SCGC-AAA259D14]
MVLDAELEPQAMVCALDLSGDTSGGLGALLLWIDQWVEEAKEVDVVLVVKGGLEQNVLEGEISLSSGGLFDTVLREKDLSPSKLAECLEVNQSDCSIISKEVKNSG